MKHLEYLITGLAVIIGVILVFSIALSPLILFVVFGNTILIKIYIFFWVMGFIYNIGENFSAPPRMPQD